MKRYSKIHRSLRCSLVPHWGNPFLEGVLLHCREYNQLILSPANRASSSPRGWINTYGIVWRLLSWAYSDIKPEVWGTKWGSKSLTIVWKPCSLNIVPLKVSILCMLHWLYCSISKFCERRKHIWNNIKAFLQTFAVLNLLVRSRWVPACWTHKV